MNKGIDMKKHIRSAAVLRKLRLLCREQAGYTFIEIAAVIAICGIISLGALMSNGQVLKQTVTNNDYTTANRHVLNAIQWITRDAQMAQDIDGASGFPATDNLTISWLTWDNVSTQVVYSVQGGQLIRSYTAGNATTENTLIAQYINIDPASSNCTWDNQELILTLTSTVGEGAHTVNVTEKKTIIPRPIL
jgi:prepilin-type N-terminal cleavage/methylation domain-containing protein